MRSALLLLGSGIALGAAHAQSRDVPLWHTDRSFLLYWENDAIFGSSDSSYTNGIRFAWDFSTWSRRLGQLGYITTLGWMIDALPGVDVKRAVERCVPFDPRPEEGCGTVGFGLTQTMYTPSNIADTLRRPAERPYAGLLYGSALINVHQERWAASSEFVIGVLGPWSHSESTQSLAHWTWSPSSGKPRGWRHQLRNSVHVGLINHYSGRPAWLEYCRSATCNGTYDEGRTIDLTPRAELALTTYMQRASVGGILRVGNRFPDVVSLARISTTAARGVAQDQQFWWALFGSVDARRVGYNAFISGTEADEGRGGWRDVRRIQTEPDVIETAYGVMTGARAGTVTLQIVTRSKEYSPGGGSHRFGALMFSLFTPRRSSTP